MKRFMYVACLNMAIIPAVSYSQNESDALRYSQSILGGTARFVSMGGAFTALGGDMTSLAYNPAGVAVFTKNQLTITPGLMLQNTSSTFNGTTNSNNDETFVFQNIGIVGTWKTKDKDNLWKSYSFGIAYNRINDFNSNITVSGSNTKSSFLDGITPASGTLDQYQGYPAYEVALLNPNSNGTGYYNIIDQFLNGKNSLRQSESIGTSGNMGETDISFGGNYNDKLFIGGSFGIVSLNYNENVTYTETPNYNDTVYGLANYTYSSSLNTSGTGFNFKLGFIYRIMDWLRVGGAIHSPTLFYLTDNYSDYFTSQFKDTNYASSLGPNQSDIESGNYTYTLTTPLRAMGGAAVIINKQGILSAEYEYSDYSTARFNSSDGQLAPVNSIIQQSFMPANNLRFGFEWVLYPISFRAGYAIYGNPYNSGYSSSSIRSTYTAGLGLKINNVFIDLAYALMQYDNSSYLYNSDPSTLTTNKTNVSSVLLTLGVNFDHQNQHAPRRERFRAYPPPPPPPPGAY